VFATAFVVLVEADDDTVAELIGALLLL